MAQARSDENQIFTLLAASEVDLLTPTLLVADPVTNELLVKATLTTGDIEIGAVEIKDGDSDTRLDVEDDGTGKNAAFVQANDLDIRNLDSSTDSVTVAGLSILGDDVIQEYGTLTIATLVETTIATTTVAVGKTLRLKAAYGEGNGEAIFRLKIAGSTIWQSRNAWTQRFVTGTIEEDAATGVAVILTVQQTKSNSNDYTGGFYGYEI